MGENLGPVNCGELKDRIFRRKKVVCRDGMPVMKKSFVIILAALATITVFINFRTAAQSPQGQSSTVWHSQDIGKPGMTGRFVQNGDLLEVYGSGADIWGAADACHFPN
jgi:hypothetical protein